jgi:hypothetical protein
MLARLVVGLVGLVGGSYLLEICSTLLVLSSHRLFVVSFVFLVDGNGMNEPLKLQLAACYFATGTGVFTNLVI